MVVGPDKDYLITLFNKDHVVSQEGDLINETLYLSLQQQWVYKIYSTD